MPNMPKTMPWVVPEYCEGCSSCLAACPRNLLSMREWSDDAFVPWLDRPDACTGCGRCATACPFGGIMMTEYVEEAAERFRTRCEPAEA